MFTTLAYCSCVQSINSFFRKHSKADLFSHVKGAKGTAEGPLLDCHQLQFIAETSCAMFHPAMSSWGDWVHKYYPINIYWKQLHNYKHTFEGCTTAYYHQWQCALCNDRTLCTKNGYKFGLLFFLSQQPVTLQYSNIYRLLIFSSVQTALLSLLQIDR